jgi:hypothetical protein
MASNIQIENTKVADLSTEELVRALTNRLATTNGFGFVPTATVCRLISMLVGQLERRSD